MKYNQAALKIPDWRVSDQKVKDFLKKVFASYFFTAKQCQLIYKLLEEFRGSISFALIEELKEIRLSNLKMLLRVVLEEKRFRDREEGITVEVVNALIVGVISNDDFNEILQLANLNNKGLYEELSSFAAKANFVKIK